MNIFISGGCKTENPTTRRSLRAIWLSKAVSRSIT